MVTSEVRTILVVAADELELKWIRPRPDIRWVLAANGPGSALAGEAADRNAEKVDAVLSAGLCGALVEGLEIGDIVCGTSVNGIDIDLPSSADRHVTGPIASIGQVAQTVAEKRRLRQTGAVVVEMEAAAVLERARQWQVPFYCIRAVSDMADEGFTLDLNATRDMAGRFRVGRILAQAARQPRTGIPELLRLRRNSQTAAKALGEFIGNCSF